MDIKKYLVERKKQVDAAIEAYFKDYAAPARLKETMLYSLRAGGKRLRPILVLASAEACGGNAESAMPVALSLEMIHTFSLIHDDLPAMDNDDLRRGMPTSHVKFGEAAAILAGDALLAEAFSCLAGIRLKTPSPLVGEGGGEGETSVEIIKDVAAASGALGMTGGQLLDMDAEGKKISCDELKKIHRFKTGALITVSVTSGAKCAGAGGEKITALKKYGDAVGLAFQIADDILDIEGTTEMLGKPAKSDTKNQKSTYPAVLGMDASKKLAKELIGSAHSALAEFGSAADPLREIARYVILRKN